MKITSIGAALAVTTIIGFGAAGTAAATDEVPVQEEGKCYEEYPEYLYERPTYTTQDQIEKEVRTRTATSNNYGYTWSAWSDWSEWSDWPEAGPVWDDGRDRGPAFHGSGYYDNIGRNREKWERQYRYVVVDTRQVETGTEQYGWTEEAPPLEGWTLIDERVSEREVPCPTFPPVVIIPDIDPCLVNPNFCPTTTPETTVPPTTEPEPADDGSDDPEPTTTVVVDTTAPPPAPTTQPPVVTQNRLPDTGNETWIMAAIAAVLIAGGGSLVAATRRH